jgi:glycosyltransferase involved in cell wall biosynthesis
LLRWIQVFRLRQHLSVEQADVVHSHLLTADWVTSSACRSLGIPWLSTLHGDYLALEAKGSSRAARIPDFHATSRAIESTAGHMVCITDQQVAQFSRLMPSLASTGRISKIYNGYAASDADLANREVPDVLRTLPAGAFAIGMVARGIRDKGWDVLVAAFEALDLPGAWLVLVGDGDHLQQIRARTRHPRIVFCGNVVDPLRYIARFDVACLPTQFPTESLPTVIIEYLCLGKPVIATAVGEMANMLEANSAAPAGLLIDLGETPAMAQQMQAALRRLYEDPAERAALGAHALNAVKKFDMNACVNAYLNVYAKALR